jgi:hypothetical protein
VSTKEDQERLKGIQRLYSIMQLYFMRKAGVSQLKREPETDEDEGLPVKKAKAPLEKDSPLKVNADKGRVEKPGGESKVRQIE